METITTSGFLFCFAIFLSSVLWANYEKLKKPFVLFAVPFLSIWGLVTLVILVDKMFYQVIAGMGCFGMLGIFGVIGVIGWNKRW